MAILLHGFGCDRTFLDPLVAILLFVAPRVGVVLLLVLMFSDVIHNTWIIGVYGGVSWMVVDQWLFLIFVSVTTRIVWRAAYKHQPHHQALT